MPLRGYRGVPESRGNRLPSPLRGEQPLEVGPV